MWVVRAGPWRKFQNVRVTACIGTPCHSIVAPSLLIVYELFTQWHKSGTPISSWQLVTHWKFFLNISKFYFTHVPSRTLSHWHAKLRAVAYTVCHASVSLLQGSLTPYRDFVPAIKMARLGTPISEDCGNKIHASVRLVWSSLKTLLTFNDIPAVLQAKNDCCL